VDQMTVNYLAELFQLPGTIWIYWNKR